MDATKWIKWEDFDEDGENGKWCIGPEDGNRVVAATVAATEQEADILAAAPDLLAALEAYVAYEAESDLREDESPMLHAIYTAAVTAIARAKGQTEEDELERARRG